MSKNKDYIFNSIAGLINASEAVIIMMMVTRWASLNDAGHLTIAFAVGNLLMTVGKWGVYNFQVTDTEAEYNYRTYVITRLITVTLMALCIAGYLIYGRLILSYSGVKFRTVLLVCLIYLIESVEDLYIGFCQVSERLWIGSLAFIVRWTTILVLFGISEYITHSTAKSLLVALIGSIVACAICLYVIKRTVLQRYIQSTSVTSITDTAHIRRLFKSTTPIFLAAFLTFYVSNAAKYALERYTGDSVQACYGFVAMPVFAIGLLNGFIYHPQMVPMTQDYRNGRLDAFRTRTHRQYAVISLLTIICVLGAMIIGIPVLSLLYHTELGEYYTELIILVLAGGFLALSGYQSIILTIIRKQKAILYGYVTVAIICIPLTEICVRYYGTLGAAISYLILMILLCLIYGISLLKNQE